MERVSADLIECKICAVPFKKKTELEEHEWSLLHHIKLEKSSNVVQHHCALCGLDCSNLADFSKHLESSFHCTSVALYNDKRLNESYNTVVREQLLAWIPNNVDNNYSDDYYDGANSNFADDDFESQSNFTYRQNPPFHHSGGKFDSSKRSWKNPTFSKNAEDWKKRDSNQKQSLPYKHPTSNIANVNSSRPFYESALPINVKNMKHLGAYKHSYTDTSFRLNYKFQNELKQQERDEKYRRNVQKSHANKYQPPPAKKPRSNAVKVVTMEATSVGHSSNHNFRDVSKSKEKSANRSELPSFAKGVDSAKPKESRQNFANVSQSRNSAVCGVKFYDSILKKHINKNASDINREKLIKRKRVGFVLDEKPKIIEADSTTSVEISSIPLAFDSSEKFGFSAANAASNLNPATISKYKKVMKPGTSSSTEISKRLLAGRMKKYQSQGCTASAGRESASTFCRSLSESSSDIELVEIPLPSVSRQNSAQILPDLEQISNKEKFTSPGNNKKPISVANSNKNGASTSAENVPILPNVDEAIAEEESTSLNAAEILNCENEPEQFSEVGEKQLDIFSYPDDEFETESSTGDASKYQQLWRCCLKEEKMRGKIFSLHQEMEQLEKRMAECQKLKRDAEIKYREIRTLKQTLLSSDITESDQSVSIGKSAANDSGKDSANMMFTYLGMIDSESLSKHLGTVPNKSLTVGSSNVYPLTHLPSCSSNSSIVETVSLIKKEV